MVVVVVDFLDLADRNKVGQFKKEKDNTNKMD
jgi:hypothetical protein